MSKWITIDGKYKLSASHLRTFSVIEVQEPHELRLVDEVYGRRYWLGSYFDNGILAENVVTVDIFDKKKKEWVQVEQYLG